MAIIGALLVAPTPALADCQMAPPIEEAVTASELVFVGTVMAFSNEGRSVTVEVEEIWRGGEMPASVTVFGAIGAGDLAGEDDRAFEAGMRYLFLPFVVDDRLVDSICTATTPWAEDFAALRPAAAQTPAAAAVQAAPGPLAAIADLALPLLTALLIGGAALAIAIVVGRRRET